MYNFTYAEFQKKSMTIDGLAVMVAKGFQDNQDAITGLDKKIDRVEKDLKLEISGLRKLLIEKAKAAVDLKELEMLLK